MKKLNHFSWSFALSFWIFYFIFDNDIVFTLINSLFVAMVAWLPDIDIRFENKLREINRETLFLAYLFTLPFRLLFRHRTITHSIWLPLILFWFAEFYFVNVFVIFILRIFYIAIFLHIFEDAFTKSGVKILFPIPFKFKLANFSTNSRLDFYLLEIFAYVILFSFFGIILFLHSGWI